MKSLVLAVINKLGSGAISKSAIITCNGVDNEILQFLSMGQGNKKTVLVQVHLTDKQLEMHECKFMHQTFTIYIADSSIALGQFQTEILQSYGTK